MSASNYEREYKGILEAQGAFVIRSAGSKAVDLVAYFPESDTLHYIECKAVGEESFRVTRSPDLKEQWLEMKRLVKALPGAKVYYALMKKGVRGEGRWTTVEPKILKKPYHWGRSNG